MTPVKVAFDEGSVGEAFFYVAENEGYFKKFGIDFTPVLVSNSTAADAALASGSVQIAGLSDPIEYYVKTGTVIPIAAAGGFLAPYFDVVANSNVDAHTGTPCQKMKDLKGKRIGLSGTGSTPYNMFSAAASHCGLSISDYDIVSISAPGAPLYAALEAGSVDAIVNDPNSVAVLSGHDGRYEVLSLGEAVPSYVEKYSTTLGVDPSWLKTHQAAVTGFQRAISAADLYIKNPANVKSVERAMVEAEGKGVATGPALLTEYKAWLPTVSALFSPQIAEDMYRTDVSDGAIKPIHNFNPDEFVAPGAPVSLAAQKQLADGGAPGKY